MYSIQIQAQEAQSVIQGRADELVQVSRTSPQSRFLRTKRHGSPDGGNQVGESSRAVKVECQRPSSFNNGHLFSSRLGAGSLSSRRG